MDGEKRKMKAADEPCAWMRGICEANGAREVGGLRQESIVTGWGEWTEGRSNADGNPIGQGTFVR